MNNGFTTTNKSFFSTAINTFLWVFTTIKLYATVCTLKVNDNTHTPSNTHPQSQNFASYTHTHTHTGTYCTLQGTFFHTCSLTHIKDIKAQGIANVEDALKRDQSKHLNDLFQRCILFYLILTTKTAFKNTKRCFFLLITMQKEKAIHTRSHWQ